MCRIRTRLLRGRAVALLVMAARRRSRRSASSGDWSGPLSRGSARSRARRGAGRLQRRADQRRRPPVRRHLGRGEALGARASVRALHAAVHVFRAEPVPHLAGEQPGHAGARRHPDVHRHLPAAPDDLDGRPAAPARLRAAHLHGLLDRRVERRHPDDHDDAHQGRLLQAHGHSRKRSAHGGRALDSSRQRALAGDDRDRSGVSVGAVHPQPGVRADGARQSELALQLRVRDGAPQGQERGAALPARREPVHRRVRGQARDAARAACAVAPRRCCRSWSPAAPSRRRRGRNERRLPTRGSAAKLAAGRRVRRRCTCRATST